MATQDVRILLTGVTGYIGGSVLAALVASPHARLRSARISVLLRDEDGSRSAAITRAYGEQVTPIPFTNLDDTAHLEEVAAKHDIVINTTLGFHPTGGPALVRGLAKRANTTGAPAPLMIHTSGISNLSDQPLTGTPHPEREFDDAQGTATYEFELREDQKEPYGQRTTELATVQAGLETGVHTLVVMAPTVYGVGTGHFKTHSFQIPFAMKYVRDRGEGIVLGKGDGVFEHVHIEDLAKLYALLLETYLNDTSKLPSGKEGIIFAATGRFTWREFFQNMADALHAKGALPSTNLREVSLSECGDIFWEPKVTEVGLASNSKTVASVAKRLGWQPQHGADSWKRGFDEEADELLKDKS